MLFSLKLAAQPQDKFVFDKQEASLITYNLAFGAVTAGIGAAINKSKTENWKEAFLRGLWQGSIGGALHYSGKKTLYLINRNQNNLYAWPAKLIHAAGNSIVENAARNQAFLKNWNINIGLFRFDFSVPEIKKFKIRLLPSALNGIYLGSKEGKFNLKTSLALGTIVFDADGTFSQLYGFTSSKNYGRAFTISPFRPVNTNREYVLAYNLVYTFQFDEYQIFNSYFKPFETKIDRKGLKTIFEKYVYLDVPYFWPAYNISTNISNIDYRYNFYWFEAVRFATNRFVVR